VHGRDEEGRVGQSRIEVKAHEKDLFLHHRWPDPSIQTRLNQAAGAADASREVSRPIVA
jgi:hypothetical protein